LLPVPVFVRLVPYRQAPSIFQFHYSDRFFAVLAWLGAVVSAAVVVGVPDRLPDSPRAASTPGRCTRFRQCPQCPQRH
jgi:hypothetical protein